MAAGSHNREPLAPEQRLHVLGRQQVVVCDDLVWLMSSGGLDLNEAKALIDLIFEVVDRHGYVLVLVDARHASPATPEARRYQAERLKQRISPSHTAIYGANVVVTTLLNFTYRAIELVTSKVIPHSFHKDEAAARTRLASERTRLRRERVESSGPAPHPPRGG